MDLIQANVTKRELKVGDRLVATTTWFGMYWGIARGEDVKVVDDLGDRWVLAFDAVGVISKRAEIAKIDIWNYFSWWPGTQEEPGPNNKPRCEHKFVNTSFMGVRMECKFCGKDEDEHKKEQILQRIDKIDIGY